MTIEIPKGYETLGEALAAAVEQAAAGKGAGRHSYGGELFSDQLIFEIPRRLGEGGECFCLGQAVKKIYESRRLEPAHARAELLGAINYLAAAWRLLGGRESVFAPDSDAPRSKDELVQCIRDCNPSVYAPEDAAVPLFAEGARVKYAVQGKWEDGAYVGVDPEGKHVVSTGSSYIHLDESLVRKA